MQEWVYFSPGMVIPAHGKKSYSQVGSEDFVAIQKKLGDKCSRALDEMVDYPKENGWLSIIP